MKTTPTDHMIDVAFWRAVPVEWRSIVRSYVDSNNATDQARGRELCAEYGVDYAAARAQVAREMTAYYRARLARMLEGKHDDRAF